MPQHYIEFQFAGEARDILAKELSDLCAVHFADWPQTTVQKTQVVEGDKSDPVAVAALIIAIPSAVLASWDLAQRMQLKTKVDHLLAWAQDKARQNAAARTTLHLSKEQVIPLHQAKAETP